MSIAKTYSRYIHVSKYAKWLELSKRRETWKETVARYVRFFADKFPLLDLEGPEGQDSFDLRREFVGGQRRTGRLPDT